MSKATPASPRFFFAQDQDSHWYMVPEEMRLEWDMLTVNDLEGDDEVEAFTEAFERYRLSGGVSVFSFTDPRTKDAPDAR